MTSSRDHTATDATTQATANRAAHRVHTVYAPLVLRAHDVVDRGLLNPLIWRCPTQRLLDHYRRHLSDLHLEAGVGTGYLLDHSRFPGKKPRIMLLDDDREALDLASQRLRRYAPRIRLAEWRSPLALDESYGSAALCNVLQRLPGTLESKATVLAHLKQGLRPGGVLFGATILGRGPEHSRSARALLALYNRQGIFHNRDDDVDSLASALQRHFERYQIELVGSVALFVAYR